MTSPNHLRLTDPEPAARSPKSLEHEIEFITIPEWSRRVGCAPDSGYRAARRNEIPGLFRIGRLMRVNWLAFVEATAGTSPADSGGRRRDHASARPNRWEP